MSILYPLMALGTLFVAVPIWLHLRRRDEANLIEFSTLRFLDDHPLARARPLWPRNWPLLLLRIAALLLLVGAFMWPYLEGSETVVVQESRVYILDNTLSHQVDGGFEAARDEIAEQLASRDVSTQIGVVELSSAARVVVRLGDDQLAAAETVRRLEPSDDSGTFIDAYRTAAEMLATSLGGTRRIILLSDSQSNQWTSGRDAPPFLQAIECAPPKAPSSLNRPNIGLSEPRARRVVQDGRHLVEAGVLLTGYGSQGTVSVVFWNRGREVARKSVTLSQSDSPQATAAMVEWECDPAEWVVAQVSIEPGAGGDSQLVNAWKGDDRVVFSLAPQRSGRVELIADSLFLRQALSPEVMAGRWEVSIRDAERLAPRDDGGRDDGGRDDGGRDDGGQADVLCVESHALVSSAVRDAIRGALSAGRGVVLWVDQSTPLIAGFLRDLGIELDRTAVAPTEAATFRYVFMEHPIFAPFLSSDFGSLSEIEFADYRRLKVRKAMPLAFAASGDPLLFEVDASPGRMLVFAFAFDRRDTNWPIQPSFIPFLDKSLGYLRGHAVATGDYEPGQPIRWEAPAGTADGVVDISRLDPETMRTVKDQVDPIAVEVLDGKASFQSPSRAGHYAIRNRAQNQLVAILNVNPSPLESDLSYDGEPAALASWQLQTGESLVSNLADQGNGPELSTLEALQQRLWWYLLLAALACFLVETAYLSRSRQALNAETGG